MLHGLIGGKQTSRDGSLARLRGLDDQDVRDVPSVAIWALVVSEWVTLARWKLQ